MKSSLALTGGKFEPCVPVTLKPESASNNGTEFKHYVLIFVSDFCNVILYIFFYFLQKSGGGGRASDDLSMSLVVRVPEVGDPWFKSYIVPPEFERRAA